MSAPLLLPPVPMVTVRTMTAHTFVPVILVLPEMEKAAVVRTRPFLLLTSFSGGEGTLKGMFIYLTVGDLSIR